MTTNFKNIVFFALTKNDEGGESICFKHLLEFHPEIRMVDLIFAGSSKCGICEPPILAEKEKDDTVKAWLVSWNTYDDGISPYGVFLTYESALFHCNEMNKALEEREQTKYDFEHVGVDSMNEYLEYGYGYYIEQINLHD